jgi:hypothetical protein
MIKQFCLSETVPLRKQTHHAIKLDDSEYMAGTGYRVQSYLEPSPKKT